MADRKVTIAVETTADTKGIDAASKGVDELGKKSADTGKKTKEAADGTKNLGQATGRAAELVGSLTGAMGANSPAAAQMGAGLRVIKSLAEGSAGGIMGLATVIVGIGVSAWTAYQRKVEESKKKLEEFISEKTVETIKSGAKEVDKISDAFGRVEKAVSAVRAAQSELAEAWQDLNKAGQEVTDMEIDRREKEELSRVAPGDAAGSTAVKNRYAQLRGEITLSRRQGDAVRAEQAARDDLEAASAKRVNIEEALKSSVSARDLRAELVDKYQRRADMSNPDEADRKNAQEKLAGYTDQLASLNKSIIDLTDSLQAAKTTEQAAGLRLQASQVRATRGMEAASALQTQTDADLDRDTQRERYSQTVNDLRSRAQRAASSWDVTAAEYRARSDAYDPQRRDYKSQGEWNKAKIEDRRMEAAAKGAEKQSAAAEKLLAQLEKTPPEKLASALNSIAQQLAALERGLSNVEARSARP